MKPRCAPPTRCPGTAVITEHAAAAAQLGRLHDEEFERLLAEGRERAAMSVLLGAEAYRELAALARAARARPPRRGDPCVLVLPGLMGSRLGRRGTHLDRVVWLDLLAVAAGRLGTLALPRGRSLEPLGAMWLNVLKLKLSLQVAGFDARFHAYDWRLSLVELGRQLDERIATLPRGEVLLVGHSMGGLVARAALAGRHAGRIRRVVQVGSPNRGSFAPVLALRGVYPTVRKLAALDPLHSAEDLARLVFRTLPALHELLPAPGSSSDVELFDLASWPDDALRPDPALLTAAREITAQLPPGDERCLQVIGVRQETVTAVRPVAGGFDYALSDDGDGTVPRALAPWPGARAWYVAEGHGALPNNGRVIDAVAELLRHGETRILARSTRRVAAMATRSVSESALRRIAPHKLELDRLSPDARRRLLEPVVSPEFHAAPMHDAATGPRGNQTLMAPGRRRQAVLRVRFGQADLARSRCAALAVAVFSNVAPAGAARALDARHGDAIARAFRSRRLPGRLGQVTRLPSSAGEARHLLCVGLGEFARLDLDAVREAAHALALRALRLGIRELACVPFGAGSGLPASAALQAQVEGFAEAWREAAPDARLARIDIVELDARKAATLLRALPGLQSRLSGERLVLGPLAAQRAGDRTPKPASRRAATVHEPVYLLANAGQAVGGRIELRVSLLTAGPRAAILSGQCSVAVAELQRLLAALAGGELAAREMPRLGARAAKLLLPANVAAGLARSLRRPVVIVHDREAARMPWECLAVDQCFPALEAGLSRCHAGDGLSAVRMETSPSPHPWPVLIATDPTGDLPGADLEREALERLLTAPQARVRWLNGADATRDALLEALADGDFVALHFAGHAYFDAERPERGGLLCAGGEVLNGADFAKLPRLPRLVFLNACEAGRVRRGRRAVPRRAAGGSIAEALLDGGVASYLGTYWPVGDSAALLFARALYADLIEGRTLGAAVVAARRAVRARGSCDWANYLHYGSPEQVLVGD